MKNMVMELAVLHENVPYTFISNYRKINKCNVNRLLNSNRFCVDKFQRIYLYNWYLVHNLVQTQLVLSTFWQTGVVFRVIMTTDTVI